MNTIVYFNDGLRNEFKQLMQGVSYWNGRNYMQCSEATKELINKLAKHMHHDESFVIKPTGELIITHNPLFIYNESIVNMIEVNGECVYSRYKGSEYNDSLCNKMKFTAKLITQSFYL